MLELVFTSAQAGLIPGRSGFCSVAWTEGMPKNLVTILENMSGYNILYLPNDARAANNPVCRSFQKIRYGSREFSVMSRIAFAGLDYTNRTNKIAHHIVFENESELDELQYGAISALLCDENFFTSWDGQPRLLPRRKHLKSAPVDGYFAGKWQKNTGHAEWAGHIANTFIYNLDDKKNNCLYLEYDHEAHGADIPEMICEIVRVLPKELHKEFTFSTYFSASSSDSACFFNAVLPNCSILPSIKRFKPASLISLTAGTPLPAVENTPCVESAKTGNAPKFGIDPEEEEEEAIYMDLSAQNTAVEEYEEQAPEDEEVIVAQAVPAQSAFKLQMPRKINHSQKKTNKTHNHNSPIHPDNQRQRMMIFAGAAALVILAIVVSILLSLKISARKNAIAEASADNEAHIFTVQELRKEKKLKPVNSEKKQKKSEQKNNSDSKKTPSDTGKDKTTSAPKTPAPKKTVTPPKKKAVPPPPKVKKEIKLSTKDKFMLLKNFNSGEKLKLPFEIKKIEIRIKNEWSDTVSISNQKDFIIIKNAKEIHVMPVDINAFPLAPRNDGTGVMKIIAESKSIIIEENKADDDDYAPFKEIISEFIFYHANGECRWQVKWDKSFLTHLSKGHIKIDNTNSMKYETSEDEELFLKYIEFENNSFSEFNDLKEWDTNAPYVKNAIKSGKTPFKADIDFISDKYDTIKAGLQIADAAKINFKQLKKEFDIFYKHLLAVDNTKLSKKLKLDANSMLTEIYNLWKTKMTEWEGKFGGDQQIKDDINNTCKLHEKLLNNFESDRKKQNEVNKLERKINRQKKMQEDLKKAFKKYKLPAKFSKILENYDSFSQDEREELCKELEKKIIRKAKGTR